MRTINAELVIRRGGRERGIGCYSGTSARRKADRIGYMLRNRDYILVDVGNALEAGVTVRAYGRDARGRIVNIRSRDARGRIQRTRRVHRIRTRRITFEHADTGEIVTVSVRRLKV